MWDCQRRVHRKRIGFTYDAPAQIMISVYVDDFAPPLWVPNASTLAPQYAAIDIVRGAISIARPVTGAVLKLRSSLDHAATALQILSVLYDSGLAPWGLSGSGNIVSSSLFDELDASEKGAATYRVGMGVAHLLAQDLLNVKQLGHFDRLRRAGFATLLSGQSRPDLVGQDANGNWVVVEAKGRSAGVAIDDELAAKRQAENVDQVGLAAGALTAPMWRVASLTDMSTDPLHVTFVDPPARRDVEPVRVTVDPVGLARAAYQIIDDSAEFTEGLQEIPGDLGGVAAIGARVPGTRIWIGTTVPVRTALEGPDEGLLERLESARGQTAPSPSADEDRTFSIGPDGFVVRIAL